MKGPRQILAMEPPLDLVSVDACLIALDYTEGGRLSQKWS